MPTPATLLGLALAYVCVLFAVAWKADRNASALPVSGARPARSGLIYALSLTVYCSSWTFYGAVGSDAQSAWSHAPIYLGPILVFLFGWSLVRRLIQLGERHRVTSIADYIGARYGKRQSLAVLVTLVAAATVLPYVALQFKALAQAWSVIAGPNAGAAQAGSDTALFTAIVLAVFTLLFGTRRLDGRERHRGVMAAIALESVVKLLAFALIAALAGLQLLQGAHQPALPTVPAQREFSLSADFIAQTLISGLAILCLPRQFHVTVVEAQAGTDTGIARWLLPLYLGLFMLLVLPISLAGARLFAGAGNASPDTWVQSIPLALGSGWASTAAFIGGISAATGMVIVATVSLAIMVTNEVIAPLLVRLQRNSPAAILHLGDRLRRTRQLTILGIMLIAWIVAREVMSLPWLAQIGFLSFLAAAQLAPALLAGLYWRRAHGVAITTGLITGLLLWLYCGVLPPLLPPEHSLLLAGPWELASLRPNALFGLSFNAPLAYATVWSLTINSLCVTGLSLLLPQSAVDARQAELFLGSNPDHPDPRGSDFSLSLIRGGQLQGLLIPFLEADKLHRLWQGFEDRYQQRILPGDRTPQFAVNEAEAVIASVIGSTSAHKALLQLENSQQLGYADLAGMVSGANRLNTFNRELLQTTVESMIQGISVVDSQLRLVAWNQTYQGMFDYPERLLYVGCPIERIYRYNAERGILQAEDDTPIEQQIARRLQWLRDGSAYRLERTLPDGKVIDIRGNPMPNGGFVSTYIDITDYRAMLAELEDTKTELELKLASGSESLSRSNALLRQENRLRAQVESRLRDAHLSKTRFMSATSHDLLQPINAARLFAAGLASRLDGDSETSGTLQQIDRSLHRAEQLIAELREIARLDSGAQTPRLRDFPVQPLLQTLADEFAPRGAERGLQLTVVASSCWLHSDATLLQRILQNLLSNAVRYTQQGRILLGLRRRGDNAELQVWDTGPGIAEADQVRAFAEFERLGDRSRDDNDGLGLGLAIVQRYADLLQHPLRLASTPGRGTLFSLTVPLGRQQTPSPHTQQTLGDLQGATILCMDNEPLLLEGMAGLLRGGGARVLTCSNAAGLQAHLAAGECPDILLVDYHLDNGDNGVVALATLTAHHPLPPAIVVSADDAIAVRDSVLQAGHRFLPKPVNPQRLLALILALLQR